MKHLISIKEGYDERIIGIADIDSGIEHKIDFNEYDISLILDKKDRTQLIEFLLEKKAMIDKDKMKEDLLKLHMLFRDGQKIRLAGITETLQDCDGTGVMIWFKGCAFGCPGCHNPEVADLNWETGFMLDFEALKEYLSKFVDWVDWIVFTGGEPLLQIDAVLTIAHWAKHHIFDNNKRLAPKKLWLYTGYELDEISSEIKDAMDVIKTGKYIQELKDDNLKFRGSSNQKLYRKNQDNHWEQWEP